MINIGKLLIKYGGHLRIEKIALICKRPKSCKSPNMEKN